MAKEYDSQMDVKQSYCATGAALQMCAFLGSHKPTLQMTKLGGEAWAPHG